MLIESILLGLIVGKIRAGKFRLLGPSLLKFSWIIFFSFALQLGTSIMISLGSPFFIKYRMFLYTAAYVLLFISLFFNIHFKCIWFILVGAIMNFGAIILNHGSMPIDMHILQELGFKNMLNSISMGALPQYIPLDKAGSYTRYLGMRFMVPRPYPLKGIFSMGDIMVGIGIFFLIQNMMMPSSHRTISRTLRFDHKKRTFK